MARAMRSLASRRDLRWLIWALASPIFFFAFVGCRAILDIHDPPNDSTASPDEPDARAKHDAKTTDGDTTSTDAGPIPAVPSCAGISVAMEAFGTANYVTGTFEAAAGGGATTNGSLVIDLLYPSALFPGGFSSPPKLTCTPAGAPMPGSTCTVKTLTLGGLSIQDVNVSIYDSRTDTASPKEVGAFGIELVAGALTTIAPAYAKLFTAQDSESPCTKEQLVTAGFVALTTDGFFARDDGPLRPMSDVRAGAQGKFLNIPTVAAKIAGVQALATIDSEQNDATTPSIIVNAPLLTALQESGHVRRAAERDTTLPICLSTDEKYPYEAYELTDGAGLELVGDGRTVTVHYPSAITLFAFSGASFPSNDDFCQNAQVETWTVPAARLQGSFVSAVGVLVVDAAASRLWVPLR